MRQRIWQGAKRVGRYVLFGLESTAAVIVFVVALVFFIAAAVLAVR